jgi:hypothetical protein
MNQETYNNWLKIKSVMEASGNTNNQFYIRACEIAITRKDPMNKFLNSINEPGRN